MFLIAESGSTKTEWILAGKDSGIKSFSTIGLNPFYTDRARFIDTITEKIVPQLDTGKVENIYFYGAGCSTKTNVDLIKKCLSQYFKDAGIFIHTDLLAAARALLYDRSGFVAILGTGTNTGIYNGQKIKESIDSLGYIMGDEGSGSYIGKKILGEYMRGYMPGDLKKDFNNEYTISRDEVFDNLNNKPLPNRYLGNFCRFAGKNIGHEYIRDIVREAFNDFFMNIVVHYPSFKKYELNISGSVGFVFRDILKETSAAFEMNTARIIRSPVKDLVKYHTGIY